MGGKRPDQYQISPGEAGATDYKWIRRAEDGIAGHVPDEKEKQRQASGGGLIPPAVPNPEAERLREEHEGTSEEELEIEFIPEEEEEEE
ncbi:MAG TPA: hypothetical protein VF832_09380 [Longimicrobiales bacterium]